MSIDWSAVQGFGSLVVLIGMGMFLFITKDAYNWQTGQTTPASSRRRLGLMVAGGGVVLFLLGLISK